MIRATLTPPRLPLHMTLDVLRALIKNGRRELAQERKSSRLKAQRYAEFVRRRERLKAYQEGLSAAQNEIAGAVAAIRMHYEGALEAASEDAKAAAAAVAAQVIPAALMTDPAILSHWIAQALSLLRRSRTLQLTYNPKYHEIMQRVIPTLPAGISVSPDVTLTDRDFTLTGDLGGVEFSWQDALARSEQGQTIGGGS
jgi:flagellar biosynthesis/type III secretory pathway protein FliH